MRKGIVIVMFIIFNAWISYRFYKQQRRNAKSWKLLVITRLSFHIIVNLVVKLPGIHFTKPSVTPMPKSLYTFDTIVIFCSFLRMIYCLNLFQNYDQQVKEYHIFNVDVYLGKREFLKSIQYRYRSHNKLFIPLTQKSKNTHWDSLPIDSSVLCVLLIPFFFLSLLVKIVEQSSDSEDQSFNSVYKSKAKNNECAAPEMYFKIRNRQKVLKPQAEALVAKYLCQTALVRKRRERNQVYEQKFRQGNVWNLKRNLKLEREGHFKGLYLLEPGRRGLVPMINQSPERNFEAVNEDTLNNDPPNPLTKDNPEEQYSRGCEFCAAIDIIDAFPNFKRSRLRIIGKEQTQEPEETLKIAKKPQNIKTVPSQEEFMGGFKRRQSEESKEVSKFELINRNDKSSD